MTKIPPLNWQTPIVNADRRPTPEFMRYFQQLGGNDSSLASDMSGFQADVTALQASDTSLQASIDDLQSQIDALGPSSGGAVMPLVDGSEPPVFITDGAGSLIAVPWSEA